MRHFKPIVFAAALLLVATACTHAADRASGKVGYVPNSADIKYGWLVQGPDIYFDTGANGDLYDPKNPTMLRIILSATDIGDKIKACVNLSCATAALTDGMYIDVCETKVKIEGKAVDDRFYEIRLTAGDTKFNSGTKSSNLKLTTKKPDHLAGSLHMLEFGDNVKVDADFDLTLAKVFKTQYQLTN